MRHLLSLAAAAPLALLAACGDTTPADQLEAEPLDESAIVDDAEVLAAAEGSTALPTHQSYAGSYSREVGDGAIRLVLNDDGTFEYTRTDGSTTRGSYELLEDGRLMIEDFDGQSGYFTLSEGDLYRLADENTPASEVTVDARFAREAAATEADGADAATDTVAE